MTSSEEGEGTGGPYRSIEEFARWAGLGKEALAHLAAAGAFAGLGPARRDALWQVEDFTRMTVRATLPGALDRETAWSCSRFVAAVS